MDSELPTSSTNATLLFYKCVLKEIEKESKILETKLEANQQIIVKQKQYIIDMENEKQRMICSFEENLREYNERRKYENKLDEQIGTVGEFLSRIIPQDTEPILLLEQKAMIKNFAIRKYQQVYKTLEDCKNYFTEKVEMLRSQIDNIIQNKILIDEADKCLKFCIDKKQRLIFLLHTSNVECKNLQEKQDLDRMKAEADIREKTNRSLNKFLQVKSMINILRIQLQNFQNEQKSGISHFHLSIDQLILKWNHHKTLNVELTSTYKSKQIELEKLIESYEENKNAEEELKLKIKELDEKTEVIQSSLNEMEKNIFEFERLQQNQIENISAIKEKIVNEEIKNKSLESERSRMQYECHDAEITLLSLKQKFSLVATEFSTITEYRNKLEHQCNRLSEDTANLRQDIEHFIREGQAVCNQICGFKEDFENLEKICMQFRSLADNEVFQTCFRIEKEQNALANIFMESQIDSLLDKNCDTLREQRNLELIIVKKVEHYRVLAETLRQEEKVYKEIVNQCKEYWNIINTIKVNVCRGEYLNIISIKQKLAANTNKIAAEKEAVEKLEKALETAKRVKSCNKTKTIKTKLPPKYLPVASASKYTKRETKVLAKSDVFDFV